MNENIKNGATDGRGELSGILPPQTQSPDSPPAASYSYRNDATWCNIEHQVLDHSRRFQQNLRDLGDSLDGGPGIKQAFSLTTLLVTRPGETVFTVTVNNVSTLKHLGTGLRVKIAYTRENRIRGTLATTRFRIKWTRSSGTSQREVWWYNRSTFFSLHHQGCIALI